ncbi:NUDIX domain-containing protein [Candidatus Woesearchaeota archaeon]|nr:NUDIX domain-containing protein [Candidatus Woesearchaeota archaeon]
MSDHELLDIVDEFDNVIGQDSKENKFSKELISRNVAIFVIDDDKKLLITKRSPTKKSFPNRYDLAACGNVTAGETYEEAAKREMIEEIGIECEIKLLDKIFNEFEENDKILRYFTAIFIAYYHGDINLNEELVELKRLTVKEVEDLINKDKELFTPGFIKDFLKVKDKLK